MVEKPKVKQMYWLQFTKSLIMEFLENKLVDKLSIKEKSINQLRSLEDVTIHRESI